MKKNTGLMRLVYATQYSWQGFKAAIINEAAFRQEFVGLVLLGSLTFFLNVTTYEQVAMLISLLAVLIVEIINSAIECVVDRIGSDHHILSGRAKDYGSLAVLLTLLIAILTWSAILMH